MKKYYLILIISYLIISCSKESPINSATDVKTDEKEASNLAPNDFEITISDLTDSSVTINWTQAKDPENDSVSYNLYLNENLVSENISDFQYQLSDLTELTNYSGNIIAIDSHNNKTEKSFTFSTKKHYITFEHLIEWNSDPRSEIRALQVLIAEDNSYVFFGTTNRYSWGGEIFFTLKIDENGNEVWLKKYEIDTGSSTPEIKKTSDGGYVIAGNINLLKLDANGELQWDIKQNDNLTNTIYSVVQTNDDGYIIGGYYFYNSSISQTTNIQRSSYIIKFDKNGNFVWENKIGESFSQEVKGLLNNNDGTYTLFGSKETNNLTYEGWKNDGVWNNDFWIAIIDEEGNLLREYTYDGGGYELPRKIIQTSDKKLVFIGSSIGPRQVYESQIYKIDLNGTVIWNTSFKYGNEDIVRSVDENANGEFVTIGKITYGKFGETGIYKFSPSGQLIFEKQFIHIDSNTHGLDLKDTSDGGYIIASLYEITPVWPYKTFTRVLKTNPDFEF